LNQKTNSPYEQYITDPELRMRWIFTLKILTRLRYVPCSLSCPINSMYLTVVLSHHQISWFITVSSIDHLPRPKVDLIVPENHNIWLNLAVRQFFFGTVYMASMSSTYEFVHSWHSHVFSTLHLRQIFAVSLN